MNEEITIGESRIRQKMREEFYITRGEFMGVALVLILVAFALGAFFGHYF